LTMDDTILDVDQVENLIKFCPTKEEMELLKVKMKFLVCGFILLKNELSMISALLLYSCLLLFFLPELYW
jgi:uncharacterized membrane protein